MITSNYILQEQYYDSIFLMRLSAEIGKLNGVLQSSCGMGTALNKDTMEELGVLGDDGRKAGPNDVILALAADTKNHADAAYKKFTELLHQKQNCVRTSYRSVPDALHANPDLNLAVITLPGDFAAAAGMDALMNGMHVFMFSDNVPLEDEIALKQTAKEKNLFMMGPDCGLSFMDGAAIGLCSKVRRGHIGIVGASGSGMQEIMCIIHRLGAGISQAIGTGGRDLKDAVGGLTMLHGIDWLERDDQTEIIVLVSKPPESKTMKKVLQAARRCSKPVVILFINFSADQIGGEGIYACSSFREAAHAAVALYNGSAPNEIHDVLDEKLVTEAVEKFSSSQRYLRGIYCGGTLAEEALLLAQKHKLALYSNIPLQDNAKLDNPLSSKENTILDIGEEFFTKGRPHVAIDPSIRVSRFVKESEDPETAVILLDFLLGYALHEDPAGMLAPIIARQRTLAAQQGRELCVIASLTGTDLDPQGYIDQKEKLQNAGVHVMDDNLAAANLALSIVGKIQEELK